MDNTTTATPELLAERKTLAEDLAYSDNTAFPGSAAWRERNAAGKALRAFDDAHPEVHRAIINSLKTNDRKWV